MHRDVNPAQLASIIEQDESKGDQDVDMSAPDHPADVAEESIKQGLTKIELDMAPETQPNLKNQKLKQKQRDEITLMLVYEKSQNGFGHKVKIFIESGYSLGLIRRFSYAGSKVIGLDEYRQLNLEREQLTFPDDYPQTQAYQRLKDVESKTRLFEYCKKPPSKRLNYAKVMSFILITTLNID